MGPIACVLAGQTHSSLLLSRGGGASRGTAWLNLSCPGPGEGARDQARRKAAPPRGGGLTTAANEAQWLPYTPGVRRLGFDPGSASSQLCDLGPVTQPPGAPVSSSTRWGDRCREPRTVPGSCSFSGWYLKPQMMKRMTMRAQQHKRSRLWAPPPCPAWGTEWVLHRADTRVCE